MAFQQVLPVADRAGTLASPTAAWPPGATALTLRLDFTPFTGLAHPFNDPSLSVRVETELSYDGGATFQPATATTFTGSPTGKWGRFDQGYLRVTPVPDQIPTHGRASYTVGAGQTVTFGVSIEVQ